MAALSSEGWFFVMSLDLYLSLTNPFTSYKANLKRYHVYVWGSGLISALILFFHDVDGQLVDNSTQGFCWANQIMNSPELGFGVFYGWILAYYCIAICIACFAYNRLQEGIASTLATRKHVLSTGRNYTLSFSVYWTGTILCYLLTGEAGDIRFSDFHPMFCFLLAAKGFVNVFAWFVSVNLRDRKQEVDFSSEMDLDLSPAVNIALRREVIAYTTAGIAKAANLAYVHILTPPPQHRFSPLLTPALNRNNAVVGGCGIESGEGGGIGGEGSGGGGGGGSGDSSSSSNCSSSSSSSSRSSNSTSSRSSTEASGGGGAGCSGSASAGCSGSASGGCSGSDVISHNNTVIKLGGMGDRTLPSKCSYKFIDYMPQTFYFLREMYGISVEEYTSAIKETTGERLGEGGRSGSFLFYSKNLKYIIKTISRDECTFLRSIVVAYRRYLRSNPGSLLTKFVGCHSIEMFRDKQVSGL
jgi:1-phosphatidylinositol-4-phosphate 5-kinase